MKEIENRKKELQRRLRSNVITKEWLERTIISLGLYGKISGVIGPYIIANVNGRMIIRLRPVDFRMSYSEAAIKGRRNMAAANKFAMFLKTIGPIYNLWKADGNNAFTGIIKYNKKYLVNDCPSERNCITPEGFTIGLNKIISADKKGKIRVSDDYRPGINEKLVIVVAAQDPIRKSTASFECFQLYCGPANAGQVIKLTRSQKQLCGYYKKYFIYTAIIREEERSIKWSNTFVREAEFLVDCYDEAERLGYGAVFSPQSSVFSLQSGVFSPQSLVGSHAHTVLTNGWKFGIHSPP